MSQSATEENLLARAPIPPVGAMGRRGPAPRDPVVTRGEAGSVEEAEWKPRLAKVSRLLPYLKIQRREKLTTRPRIRLFLRGPCRQLSGQPGT